MCDSLLGYLCLPRTRGNGGEPKFLLTYIRRRCGFLVQGNLTDQSWKLSADVQISSSERELLTELVHLVRSLDPDIVIGYELQNSSWGYLIERARQFGKFPSSSRDDYSDLSDQIKTFALSWGASPLPMVADLGVPLIVGDTPRLLRCVSQVVT